jgi:hypothetical protein
MRPLWIQAALALAAVWLLVGGVSWWARNARPTPDSVAKYLDTHSLEGRSANDRREIIESVANQLNRFTYEERRETRMQRRPDRFFKDLTPEEQAYFLDRTLPQGFKQMMEAFNKMTPEKRKQFVEKAIADMRRGREDGGDGRPPDLEDPNVQKMVDTGLKSFYSEASADTKMDLAPLIEEMQQNMQGR